MRKDAEQAVDVVRISRQLSWVLRRGARQSGVRVDGDGWVQVCDLLRCKYFENFSEEQLLAIISLSNRSKLRYELREKANREVRATRRDEDELQGLVPVMKIHKKSPACDRGSLPPSANSIIGSREVVSSRLDEDRNSNSPVWSPTGMCSTPAPTKLRSAPDYTPVSKLNATAKSFVPAMQHHTVARNLYSSCVAHQPTLLDVTCPLSVLGIDLSIDKDSKGVLASKRLNPAASEFSPATESCRRGVHVDCPYVVKNQSQQSVKVDAEAQTCDEVQRAEDVGTGALTPCNQIGTTAELQVPCATLTDGSLGPLSDQELQDLACDSLEAAGFAAEEIVKARIDHSRNCCVVEVLVAAGPGRP